MLPTKFQVNWLLGLGEEAKKKKKKKKGFQDGHLGFPISRNLAIFDLQVTLILPTKFGVIWPFSSGNEVKIDFQVGGHGSHLGFPIRTILAIFAKNRFSRWPPWRPSSIYDRHDFSYF